VPLIVGGEVFVGATAVTALAGADAAVVDPLLLVAVTAKRKVKPMSAVPGEYVIAVEPLMALQFDPPESQRSHW
jgi:hypothetical protein